MDFSLLSTTLFSEGFIYIKLKIYYCSAENNFVIIVFQEKNKFKLNSNNFPLVIFKRMRFYHETFFLISNKELLM